MTNESTWTLRSPDDRLAITIVLSADGELSYDVVRHDINGRTTAIGRSRLGLSLDRDPGAGLAVAEIGQERVIDEKYRLAFGKRRDNRHHARERTLGFVTANGVRLDLVLRAADDGVAFRYRLPHLDGQWTVTSEHTSFNPGPGRCWIAPYDEVGKWGPAYETLFVDGANTGTAPESNEKNYPGWQFPALFSVESLWVLLTESDLDGHYCGCHLKVEDGCYRIGFPPETEALGVGRSEPTGHGTMQTPWRVIVIAPDLAGVVESSLVTDLAAESRIEDPSWVCPGRSSWSWWSDFDSSTDHDSLRGFVDLAADMGWEYSTVDANWHTMSDHDLERLVRYSAERGVRLLLWYNSGGPTNDVPEGPRGRLSDPAARAETMAWLHEMGIAGLKVDFFDSDKQVVIQQYLDLLEEAARHRLLVNLHGSTLPRGWDRTWPNCISMEAVRGGEQYRLDTGWAAEAPRYNTILPFTRNVVGSVDYTPLALAGPGVKRVTTDGHELALCVVLESGMLTVAGSTEAIAELPDEARAMLRRIPVAWDETRLVSGFPGTLAVMGRRAGSSWWLAGINGRNHPLPLAANLSFLGEGEYVITTVTDNKSAQGLRHGRSRVTARDFLNVRLPAAGGFLAHAVPIGEVDDPPDPIAAPRSV